MKDKDSINDVVRKKEKWTNYILKKNHGCFVLNSRTVQKQKNS